MTFVVTDEDRARLRRAIELAERGRGAVSPSPVVGAVITSGDTVIGEGHHAAVGDAHAEVAALADCRERGHDPAGATLYVSLEPCAHQGRQPPCTEAILDAAIARVLIASDDPSARASGRGPAALRDRGVEVSYVDGDEAAAARLANQAFRKHARTGRPLVTLKSALSLDGFTATAGGDSKWISGPESRALVHRWRGESDAVAVGIGTTLADDPLLTARDLPESPPRQPLRVIFDSDARLPLDSKLVGSLDEAPMWLVAEAGVEPERVAALNEVGVDVIEVPGTPDARIGLALDELGQRSITSVLLEGGAELAGSFQRAGEVDELRLFIAPKLLGGGRRLFAGAGAELVADAQRPLASTWEQSGEDMLVRARLREW